MLTKKERTSIADRLRNADKLNEAKFYEAITGRYTPAATSYEEDLATISNIILDLCDTSNMVELPLDKDGEVINVGDTLYYGSKTTYKVKKIIYKGNKWEIQFFDEKLCITVYDDPDAFTHKKPVTIASLVSEIRHTISKSTVIDRETISKLWGIADQLEKLRDSDD